MSGRGNELLITVGGDTPFEDESLTDQIQQVVEENTGRGALFAWNNYWLAPLFMNGEQPLQLLGLLGVERKPEPLDEEQAEALRILAQRARMAILDRYRQQQAFNSLEELTLQMDIIQRLRAASRYNGARILSEPEIDLQAEQLSPWVKDALTHYWGGPKLTQNPLLSLQVVQKMAATSEENSTNALRAVLRKAIENVRPEGERRFTGEWILYNILEMKFLEGRKVREIAMRLALSEADLYRKQRVAIEAVAAAIIEMEQQARQGGPLPEATNLSTAVKGTADNQKGNSRGGKT
jgi:hypothetical protein